MGKLFGKDEASKILSGFTQSVYYNENGKVVDVNTEGKSDVRKVSSITTGIYSSNQKTYSSSFTPDDIIEGNISQHKRFPAGSFTISPRSEYK